MKRTILLTLLVATGGLSTVAQDPQPTAPPKPPPKHQIVTAAQANGVYRYYKASFVFWLWAITS